MPTRTSLGGDGHPRRRLRRGRGHRGTRRREGRNRERPDVLVAAESALAHQLHELPVVEFLDELLYLGESEELVCDRFRLAVEGTRLEAMVEGVPIVAHGKEIKAVTYHRLEIEETEDGLQTRIVFDV